MEVTQDKILYYLNQKFLAIPKANDEEAEYMFKFLIEKKLMSLTHIGSATITNEGMAFIRNAYYFNPVPQSVFDWTTNIVEQLRNGQAILNGDGELKDQALFELKQDGIVEQVGTTYFTTLTSKGRQIATSAQLEEIKISILKYLTRTKGKKVVITVPNNENINDRLFKLAINELIESIFIRNTTNAGWVITSSGENFLTRHDFGLVKEEKPIISNTTYHLQNSVGAIVGDNNQSSIIAERIITNPIKINETPKTNSAYSKILMGILIAVIAGIIVALVMRFITGK